MDKNCIKRSYIKEKDLMKLFQIHYNDIFSEILKINQKDFLNILKSQVLLSLNISKKYAPQILLKKIEEIYIKKYLEEKDIVLQDYNYLKNCPKEQLDYLEKLNCVIHCTKCKNALHICGFKLIIYGNFFYCLSCMKVYNENLIEMYCDECDEEYYTKLREIADYNIENYFLVSIKDYHCRMDNEEKIKCPQCNMDLYVNILDINNFNKIEVVTCLYCNLTFDANLFIYKCKKCGINFKSEAKIYNEFYNKTNDLLCQVHTLLDKRYAGPESVLDKTCECNLNNVIKYKHNDGGILYEGERNGLKIIVCDKCYQIFDYYNFVFSCPLCGKFFNCTYVDNFPQNGYDNFILNKNEFQSDQNSSSNKEGCCCYKCQCSTQKEKKTKNIIINNPFNSRNSLLKVNNTKYKNTSNSKNASKTYREEEKKIASKKFNHTKNKNKNQSQNQNQNINIKIQNFYNNYAPIIHIIEKNQKSVDKNNDSKYLINRNYTLIHTSPKIKKLKNNIINSTKFISNASILKRSITETEKYNLGINHSNTLSKNKEKQKNLNEEENEPNLNYSHTNNNYWNQKKKFSSSFTLASNFDESPVNNCINNHSQNKIQKKRYSAENNKIKGKKYKERNNISKIANKKKILTKVNTIKERKEEYLNEIKEIKIKKPKGIKYENTDNSTIGNKSSKKITKIIISSSFLDDNNKKVQKGKEKIKTENNESNLTNKTKKLKSKNEKTNGNFSKKKNNSNNNLPSTGNPKSNMLEGKNTKKNNQNDNIKNKSKSKIIKNFNSEDYNILSMLGEGTFSQIFLVENGKTHEKFALKKMTANKMSDLEKKRKEFEFILKLTTEDDKLNLVKIKGIQIKQLDKFNMVLYILMEAAISDWETELKNRHFSKEYYSEEELKNIIKSIVQTFSSLQKKGICHRDVKPQNILSFGNGIYKITDFGEAKTNNNLEGGCKFNFSQNTSVQTIRGTELYMSPILFEALRNSSVYDLQYNAFKSDVFSLGLCFLLAASLTYKPLSQLRDIKNMSQIKSLIEKFIKDRYSKKFIDVLIAMLQLEEKDRPDFIELENIVKNL